MLFHNFTVYIYFCKVDIKAKQCEQIKKEVNILQMLTIKNLDLSDVGILFSLDAMWLYCHHILLKMSKVNIVSLFVSLLKKAARRCGSFCDCVCTIHCC